MRGSDLLGDARDLGLEFTDLLLEIGQTDTGGEEVGDMFPPDKGA